MSKITLKQIIAAGFTETMVFGIEMEKWVDAINMFQEAEEQYLVINFRTKSFSVSDELEGATLNQAQIDWLFFRK